jgi:hypothetical protein
MSNRIELSRLRQLAGLLESIEITDKDLSAIAHKVQTAAVVFPEKDPKDVFGPWIREHGYTMADVDAALQKSEGSNYNQYMAGIWDELAEDELATLKKSYFIKVDGNSMSLRDNPYKS